MLELPAKSSTAMLYSSRRYRGLGLLRCDWEAPLQHWSLAQKLARIEDSFFRSTFDYAKEVQECKARLSLPFAVEDEMPSVRHLGRSLREAAFEEWSR